MSPLPRFPPLELVQVVYVTITDHPSRVLVARSPDVPGRAAFACDRPSLEIEIRKLIEEYFAQQGEMVRVYRKRDLLSTWQVETIGSDTELLIAAE